LDMIKKMCDWLVKNDFENYPLHFSRFHPLYKLTHLPATPVSTLRKAKQIALNAGLKFVYIGNVPGEDQNTYCPNCQKIVIERKGFRVLQNHISAGNCEHCNTVVPGRWDL
jgi:pyruvate formate lyase activating enzyme